MDTKNKNEELQSRRDFFKKAAKKALPILGAIVLANTPNIVKAADVVMDCESSCSGSCKGSCRGNCAYSCSTSCVGSCKGECGGGCKGTCYGCTGY